MSKTSIELRHVPIFVEIQSTSGSMPIWDVSMNIWILNHYADSPDRQATRSYDLSRKLVERGHIVTIFAAGFSHYRFTEEQIQGIERFREENWNGGRFLLSKTPAYKGNSWRRIWNMVR